MADLAASRSLAELFIDRVAATPDRTAFSHPAAGAWKRLTWKEVGTRVREIACGLRALGLQPEERCAILSATRLEWVLVDLGVLCAGGAATTIYPSSTPDECAFILKDSGSAYAFVEDARQLAKLLAQRARLPGVRKVVLLDGQAGADAGDWVVTLADLQGAGRKEDQAHPERYEEIARAVRPEALATLVYTSGTTGEPKGVELVHDCWVYTANAIDELRLLTESDVQYLWLPLSHVFGKVLEAAQLRIGFETAIDGRVDKLVENLAAVRPTFVAVVPRILEKVHNKIVVGAQASRVKHALFRWAFRVGRRVSAEVRAGRRPGGLLAFEHRLAERLVFARLHALFGGRLRFLISGSAPLALDLSEFFHAAGILVAEGYGLTESSAASFVNRPERFELGTVGLPLPGTEVRIAPEDGEILLRGRGIMRGYYNRPEATAEALDADHWLHTGDIGQLDAQGFLRITDRKKDLIKTSGGKYVAPQAIEGRLKAACPYVSQVVVHGNNRNYCSALFTLDPEAIRGWAQDHGLGTASIPELAAHATVRAMLQEQIDALNASLPSYSTVKKFAILPADLTQEAGELTPSLKVKRKVVEQRYKDVLDSFYKEPVASL